MFKALSSTFKKFKNAFSKLRFTLGSKLKNLLTKGVDDDSFEELERLFYESDLGAEFSMELAEKVRKLSRKNAQITSEEIIAELKKEVLTVLGEAPTETVLQTKPHVILVVGTNGSGKTTSIAKLAKKYSDEGKKVLISASDTFRAAAIDQIATWAERLNVDIVKSQPGSDPSAVVFDAISSAIAKSSDVVLVDTAGRLHTKTDLMVELEKIQRVMKKLVPDAPHETLLVLDATCGQNAIDQAEIFNRYTPISSVILTKLDGTAKGGVIVALKKQKDLEVKYIGLGEQASDLILFDPVPFTDALFKAD